MLVFDLLVCDDNYLIHETAQRSSLASELVDYKYKVILRARIYLTIFFRSHRKSRNFLDENKFWKNITGIHYIATTKFIPRI